MNTEARRKASAAYHAKRTAAGDRKVTVWLSPAARAVLEALKAVHGTKDKAAELAILAFAAEAKDASKPPKTELKHTPKPVSKQPKAAPGVQSSGLALQIGPVSRAPGSMLKGSKK